MAAFVFEPVVGAAGGVVPAPPGYARMVREICDRHGVLMIADEVMCGTGRCGTWRALEHDGVTPDVMAVAKGLGGGYVPLGATLYHDKIAAVLDGLGGPMTGHTFTGHTLACAAGVAVQRIVDRDQLVERVRADGPRAEAVDRRPLRRCRTRRRRPWPRLLRRPRVRRRPGRRRSRFRPRPCVHLLVRRHALDHGLICYPSGGNVDGVNGDTVIIAPPFNATHAEIDEIVDKLDRSVRAALADVTITAAC